MNKIIIILLVFISLLSCKDESKKFKRSYRIIDNKKELEKLEIIDSEYNYLIDEISRLKTVDEIRFFLLVRQQDLLFKQCSLYRPTVDTVYWYEEIK